MSDEVIQFVTQNGYLAIFILIFLQETGMPNPFPNELLLLFCGYLSFKGLLFFPYVIITAFLADFLGTILLYLIFYSTGTIIMERKPKWFPLSDDVINRLSKRLSEGGQLSIFIFRLTPFTRGYASVITGLLQVKPKIFLPIAIASAICWASVYVVIGNLIGPSWDEYAVHFGSLKYLFIVVVAIALGITIIINFRNIKLKRNRRDIDNSPL